MGDRGRGTQAAELVGDVGRRVSRAVEVRLDVLVFIAALASLPGALSEDLSGVGIAVDVAAWLVFVLEAVVLVRAQGWRDYLADRWHWIDVGIVVLSAPYHLIGTGGVLALLGLTRFARLARLAIVMVKVLRQSRSVFSRRNLPVAGAVVALVVFVAAAVVFRVDGAEAGFATYGDALWWSFVTLTTVGYGDLSPISTVGRIAAVVVMLAGVAFLGTIAASLASLFVDDEEESIPSGQRPATSAEVAELRAEIAELRQLIEAGAEPRRSDADV